MSPAKKEGSSPNLAREVAALREVVEKAHASVRRDNQFRRQLALSFLKGTVSALGAIATVVIIMPVFVWFLQAVSWPPLIADAVSRVIHQLEQGNRQSLPGAVDQ